MSPYTDAVESGLKGLEAVSTGPCPGCEQCADDHGYDNLGAFEAAWEAGDIEAEGSFSWSPCGICGSHLGGDREPWHAIAGEPGDDLKGREILHFSDACIDCVVYLANGDEPETWGQR